MNIYYEDMEVGKLYLASKIGELTHLIYKDVFGNIYETKCYSTISKTPMTFNPPRQWNKDLLDKYYIREYKEN